MRAMMLCGAALMKRLDERLPFLIAEFLTESTTMQDIQRIISRRRRSRIQEKWRVWLRRLWPPAVAAIRCRWQAALRRKTVPPWPPEPAAPEDKNLEETRKNVQHRSRMMIKGLCEKYAVNPDPHRRRRGSKPVSAMRNIVMMSRRKLRLK